MATEKGKFVFRRNDTIGAAAAEEDRSFLQDCYVDTGDIEYLLDCKNPLRVIVGRTGAGKTALMLRLSDHVHNVIELSPHSLSLNYIANNGVIAFFEEAGVNLALFYGLLWKHILVVELLKKKFKICDEDSQKQYQRKVRDLLFKKDKNKEMAVEYLEKWGDKFWLTTEERIKELTTKIEKSLSGSVKGSVRHMEFGVEAAKSLSSEERKEIVHRGQQAVSEVQIRELQTVIAVLAESVFSDRQNQYFVLIDMLDEEWADERIKFRLIKSLLDSIRSLRTLENVKVIVSIRQDLLDKVVHSISDPGFQEEKYESMYLRLKWSKEQLTELVSKRISYLVKHRYTTQQIGLDEVFPGQIDGKKPIEYLMSRTFLRPRDLIQFLNECIKEADSQPSLSTQAIRRAEHEYSFGRLQSLATEWQIIYPDLREVSQLFYGMKSHFPVSELSEEYVLDKYVEIAGRIASGEDGRLIKHLSSLYSENANFVSVRSNLLIDLFVTGLIGIKVGAGARVSWSHESRGSLAPSSIRAGSTVYIHPMFYRALDIRA